MRKRDSRADQQAQENRLLPDSLLKRVVSVRWRYGSGRWSEWSVAELQEAVAGSSCRKQLQEAVAASTAVVRRIAHSKTASVDDQRGQ